MRGRPAAERSPLPLRLLHAAVFLSLAAAAIALGAPELEQLLFAWSRPWHYGEPPSALALLGAVLAGAGGAAILAFFVRSRSVPLLVSALPLVGLGLGYLGRLDQPPRRTHHAANLDILAAGRQLHRLQVDALQQKGELPSGEGEWRAALQSLGLPRSPARGRDFAQRPFELVKLERRDQPLDGLRPGTLTVWIAAEGAEFELRMVGFDPKGKPRPLLDQKDAELTLTGAYNPAMQQPALPEPSLVAPSPNGRR